MRIQMGTATRLFALVLATSTALSIALGIAVHGYALHLLNERLDADLLRSAHVVGSLLNREETVRASQEGQNAAGFAQYADLVGQVQQSAGVGGVYTCVPSGEDGCVLGLDSYGGTGKVYEYAKLEPEVAAAWRKAATGADAVTPIYEDKHGSWKSALVAVKDEDGKVAYLLGVDLDAGFVQQEERSLLWMSLGGVAVMTLIWVAIAYVITRRVVGPVVRTLKGFQAVVDEVAGGNLAVAQIAKTGDTDLDRTSEALNSMVERLRTLVKSVVDSAQFVVETTKDLTSASAQSAQAADEAAHGVGRVATGTGEQASLATDVNRTVAQVQQAIEQIAQGADQSSQEVQGASQLMSRTVEALATVVADAEATVKGAAMTTEASHQGAAEVARTLEGMKRIRSKVTESSQQVNQLHQLSTQIDEITSAISGIAEQTNLLALNAAIEAARAGEHGRGFSVVADEVRKLAERSAKSAHQIAELIGEIQQRTAQVVQSMQEGDAEVAQGIQFADGADAALKRIQEISDQAAGATHRTAAALAAVQQDAQQMASAFTNVAAVTEENSAATEEMSAGAGQVTDSVARIAQLSQESAAAAQQVSASTEELAATAEEVSASVQALEQIAEDLRKQVSHFRL